MSPATVPSNAAIGGGGNGGSGAGTGGSGDGGGGGAASLVTDHGKVSGAAGATLGDAVGGAVEPRYSARTRFRTSISRASSFTRSNRLACSCSFDAKILSRSNGSLGPVALS